MNKETTQNRMQEDAMRYDRASLGNTMWVARELARKDGRLRYVKATALGFLITLHSPRKSDIDYYMIGAENWRVSTFDCVTRIRTKQPIRNYSDQV